MERRDIHFSGTAMAALALAVSLAQPGPLLAQPSPSPGSLNDFQLPPGEAPPPPPVAGPVDPEQPVPVQVRPAPLPQPDVAPPPVAAPTLPPTMVLPQSPGKPAASAPAPAAQPGRRRSPAPKTSSPPPEAVPVEPTLAPTVAPPQTSPVPTPAPAPASVPIPWLWWLAGAALALLLAGIGWSLRRRRHSDAIEETDPADNLPLPAMEAPMPPRQTGLAPPPRAPIQVELAFEPQRLTMALVNATLAYRLSVTNRGEAAIGPLSIASDIIPADASIGDGRQLLSDSDLVGPGHQLSSLDPGETISLSGDLQLPIAAIRPVRSGDASLFVPLARFRLTALDAGGPLFVNTRIFIIGESPEQPGQRLRPIRMDKGPRTLSRISQREVEFPA